MVMLLVWSVDDDILPFFFMQKMVPLEVPWPCLVQGSLCVIVCAVMLTLAYLTFFLFH